MKHYGIEPRHGGEAVKTQWICNDMRRKQASELLSQINRKLAKEGRHVRQGINKQNSELIRKIADKLKNTTSAKRPEVREKFSATKVFQYAVNPASHPNARMKLTDCKKLMYEFLKESGFRFVFNYRLGRYWINFFLPDIKLGIECRANGRFPLSWQRHSILTSAGLRMYYINNRVIKTWDFSELHKYISGLYSISALPAVNAQDTVIWGHRSLKPFAGQPDNLTIKRSFR
jgi:very-short-patch-repair endonuclease